MLRPLRRRLALFFAAAAAALLLPLWHARPEGEPPRPERRLVVALGAEPTRLDPHDARDAPSAIVNFHLYDRLVELSPDLSVEPGLARSWEVSEGGRVWTFHLEPGVTFHDGEPLTAEAVAWNFRRLLDPGSTLARRDVIAEYVEEVRPLSELAFEVRLKEPVGPFLKLLAHDALGIVSPRAFAEEEGKQAFPAGTGPFRLKEWVPGDHLILEAFDGHWRGRPAIDQVVVVPVPEGSGRAIMLETGAAHLAFPVDPVHLPRLSSLPEVEVVEVPGLRAIYAAFNLRRPPFSDLRARRAASHAVDTEAIAERVLFGRAHPLLSPMAPSVWGYERTSPFAYDPAKARRLLEEAGIAPGARVELWGPSGRYPQDRAVLQAVAWYLEAVGFDVHISLFEWATYLSRLAAPAQWDMALLGWVPSTGDADMALRPLYHSAARGNHGGYRNEEVDRLLEEAVREVDEERRLELYRRVQEAIAHDAPALLLFSVDMIYARRRELAGVRALPTELLDFRFARFDDEPAAHVRGGSG